MNLGEGGGVSVRSKTLRTATLPPWWGQTHYKGHCKGWALKFETFLGPEMATSIASAIWAHYKLKIENMDSKI